MIPYKYCYVAQCPQCPDSMSAHVWKVILHTGCTWPHKILSFSFGSIMYLTNTNHTLVLYYQLQCKTYKLHTESAAIIIVLQLYTTFQWIERVNWSKRKTIITTKFLGNLSIGGYKAQEKELFKEIHILKNLPEVALCCDKRVLSPIGQIQSYSKLHNLYFATLVFSTILYK